MDGQFIANQPFRKRRKEIAGSVVIVRTLREIDGSLRILSKRTVRKYPSARCTVFSTVSTVRYT